MEEKIHIKGTFIESDTKAVAIVGSRQMTDYGKMVAWKFAYELAKRDITIVSGLAKGVDTVAHTAALKAGGRTIAVLGSGINTIYPVENTRLSEVIVQHGALMSLFADDAPPAPKNFLERNKLIAQLSLCTIVIE
jgi:DNA processing protein